MTISPLPTPPSRQDDPDNFVSKADAFLGALPTFQSEANALAVTVNGDKTDAEQAVVDAAAQVTLAEGQVTLAEAQVALAAAEATAAANSEAAAAASANFKGNWSDLTGPLNIPASVAHSGGIWILLEDLPDVTTEEPSSSNSKWLSTSESAIVLTYENRGTLRTTVQANGSSAVVLGIGIFVYVEGSTRFDDGEFAFAVTGEDACWELQAVSWDVVYSYIVELYGLLPEIGGAAPLTVIEYGQKTANSTSISGGRNYRLSLGVTVDASKGEQIIVSNATIPSGSTTKVPFMYPAVDGSTKTAYAVYGSHYGEGNISFGPNVYWMKVRVQS